MATAAQKVYNQWNVTSTEDDPLNGGGICQDIADAIANVVNSKIKNVEVHIVDSQGMIDQHVWVCVCNKTECFDIDIPASSYETGSGYSWKKIPNVTFNPNYIVITKQKYRPENY